MAIYGHHIRAGPSYQPTVLLTVFRFTTIFHGIGRGIVPWLGDAGQVYGMHASCSLDLIGKAARAPQTASPQEHMHTMKTNSKTNSLIVNKPFEVLWRGPLRGRDQ